MKGLAEFQSAHALWLQKHVQSRSGERKDRLLRGHGHGEKLFLERVWWPMFGHFDGLHPEYEVRDWRGSPSFLDFVWFRGAYRLNFEIKGYGPHVQQSDRTKYTRELLREMNLYGLGYRTVSVPYDALASEPQLVQSLLQAILSRLDLSSGSERRFSPIEAGLLQVARRTDGYLYPHRAAEQLGIHTKTAQRYMRKLAAEGWLVPVQKGTRVCRYRLPAWKDDVT
ncbi:hypothetical protein [Paenibacillus sp. B01]|uniref:hypothetical protein n=1 Tax=Paenibacillus sp. B01 TaxID=2660554 RepID=UPI00129AE9F2|nr:hypothetical protein [Paenibacillus sp. B01]QGG57346.1 hypothetical protein GE073_18270 [Paenibacillus sp. B01]